MGSDPASEVADELEFHIEMRIRELESQGWTRAAARAEVIRHFGDLERLRRECASLEGRRIRGLRLRAWWSDLGLDIAYALRQLRQAPGFAVAAVLTLALGIGGTTAIFSVVQAVVLRPFPFARPDRVVTLWEEWRGVEPIAGDVSAGNFVDWQAMSRSFTSMSALRWGNFNLSLEETPERVLGVQATHEYFDVFGVRPALGRVFTAEEDAPGRDRVVVLSHELWATRFDADPGVVGRDIRLNGEPYSVIGVMPAGFDPFDGNERLWVPIAFTPERRQMHDEHYLNVAARLAEGVSMAAAQTEMDGVAATMRERFPQDNADRGIRVMTFADAVVDSNLRSRLFILLGAVGLVLLIGCGNVANLQLAGGASRGREFGVRAAIGAGRSRLIRQLLTESVVLAVLSAIAGLAVAWVGLRLLVAAAPPGVPRLATASLDGVVLAFTLVVSLLTAVVFGLAPTLGVARRDLFAALREGGRGTVSGARDVLRGVFIAGEVALAFALLAGAVLLIRTAIQLGRDDPGFDPSGVVSARVSLPPGAYGDGESARRAFDGIARQLAESPGIEAAGLSSQVPAGPGGGSNGLIPEGRELRPENRIDTRLRIVTPGYFETLGIDIVRGRAFTDADVAGMTRVMIVSEQFASIAWPGEDPIGRRVVCCEGTADDPMWKTVVGVVRDVKWRGPGQSFTPEFYLPLAQSPAISFDWIQRTMTMVVRPRGGAPQTAASAMRAAVAAVSSGTPIFDVRTLQDRLRGTFATSRFNAQLLAVLGAVGLLLAVIGIYGVVSYYANRRVHEIGLRMALGATSRQVARLVTVQGIRPVIAGLCIGAAAAFAATRLLGGVLFGVAPTDPATFAGVATTLLLAAVLAALLPARRAMRLDPGRVLTRG